MLRFFITLILSVIALDSASASCKSHVATITFIDVGEGDATIIESNEENILIDAGNIITGHKVLKTLTSRQVNLLERIIITHPHPDHMGGIFQVAQQIPFHSIHDNGENLQSPPHDTIRWYKEFVHNSKGYSALSQGDSFMIGSGTIKVLWPPRPLPSTDWNTNSLVMSGEFNGFRFLLMGDGNLATEASLIRSGIDLKADVLKVGHHGAEDASSEAFIKRVAPEISIVSVNGGNVRGYPSERVLKRLKRFSEVYSTDTSGSVTISVCSSGQYEITRER